MSALALRGFGCNACRRNALLSFVSIAGVTVSPYRTTRSPLPQLQQRAHLSLTHARPSNAPSSGNLTPPNQPGAEEDAPEPDDAATASHVPWYLREQETMAPTQPHRKQDQLPPLPNNPPPILQVILEHVSMEIGLDNLAVVDLRGVDPPPPLGMDLIMIIGTARSEKHLNTGADRLCRWLRRTHKLSASADGLMGRNELKIKLRRKARRAKRAQNIGRQADGKDDGLSTGWICVNAGQVEDGQPPKETTEKPPGFVGFGDTTNKARIVVQMLTEPMRAEFDLDALWTDRLDDYEGEWDKNGVREDMENLEDEVRRAPGMTFRGRSNGNTNSTYSIRSGTSFEQRRGFHMTAPLQSTTALGTRSRAGEPHRDILTDLRQSRGDPSDKALSLLQHLSQLPPQEALHELGSGPHDQDSTLFLRMFYESASKTSSKHVFDRLRLIRAAVALQHPNYNKTDLLEAFQDLAASTHEISQSEGLLSVQVLLSIPQTGQSIPRGAMHPFSDGDLNMALQVLDHLSLRGMNILNEDVILLLFSVSGFQKPVSCSQPRTRADDETTTPENLSRIHRLQNRLIKIMDLLNADFSESIFRGILRVLHYNQNYETFWKLWRRRALRKEPRTKEDYLLMFRLHAERGAQQDVIKCLTECVPIMAREEPAVFVDEDLIRPLMDCLLIADPQIQVKAEQNYHSMFVDYWKKCIGLAKELHPQRQHY